MQLPDSWAEAGMKRERILSSVELKQNENVYAS